MFSKNESIFLLILFIFLGFFRDRDFFLFQNSNNGAYQRRRGAKWGGEEVDWLGCGVEPPLKVLKLRPLSGGETRPPSSP